MIVPLLLALLFVPVQEPGVSADRSSLPEDPCRLARRIAEAPPCLHPSDCQAVELWRQAFGAPDLQLVRPGAAERLPRALESRLPDRQITFGEEKEPLASVLRRLGEASGLDVLVDRRVTGDFHGEPGTVPLDEAWRRVLTSGQLAVVVQGKTVLVGSSRDLSVRPGAGRLNCPAR